MFIVLYDDNDYVSCNAETLEEAKELALTALDTGEAKTAEVYQLVGKASSKIEVAWQGQGE